MKPLSEVTSSELPFLIVYGGVVWKIVMLLLAVALIAIGRWFARGARRTEAKWEVYKDIELSTKRHELVRRGRIVRGSAVTVTQGDLRHAEQSDVLTIDCDGEVVDVERPVLVQHGSREQVWFWRVPPHVRARVGGMKQRIPTTVKAIGVGDAVVVFDAGGDSTVRISAQPAAAPSRAVMPGTLLFFLCLLPVAYAALALAGKIAMTRVIDLDSRRMQLAAALPYSRAQTLARIHEAFDSPPYTERGLRVRLALARFEGKCPVDLLTGSMQLEEALKVARACGTKRDVGWVLVLLGRYHEASELLISDTSNVAGIAAIGAGQWQRAASLLDARAAAVEHGQREYPRCLAALLMSYATSEDAFTRLDATTREHPRCIVLRTLLLPAAQQREAFASMAIPEWDWFDGHAIDLFANVAGTVDDWDRYDLDDSSFPWALWLAPDAVRQHQRVNSPHLDRRRAEADYLALLKGEIPDPRPYVAGSRSGALVYRRLALAHPQFRDATFRETTKHAGGLSLPRHCEESPGAAVSALEQGDATPFVAALEVGCGMYFNQFDQPTLALLAPDIRVQARELAAALRYTRASTHRGREFPFEMLVRVGWDRDIARLLGDDDSAAEDQRLIANHAAVLADTRRVIAMTYWPYSY